MDRACPDCGAETEYVEGTSRVLRGSCAACGHAFLILADDHPVPPAAGTGVVAAGASADPDEPASAATVDGLECDDCHGPLAVQATAPDRLEVACADCGTSVAYVLASAVAPTVEGRRFPPREREYGRSGGPDRGPPRARPCRECGGPLRFSTDDDGNVTGECASCGNRFTLPPRREGGRGPERRGGPRRGPSDRYRRGGGWGGRDGGDRRGPSRGPPRRFRRDDGDGDDDRRRRRRRTE